MIDEYSGSRYQGCYTVEIPTLVAYYNPIMVVSGLSGFKFKDYKGDEYHANNRAGDWGAIYSDYQ